MAALIVGAERSFMLIVALMLVVLGAGLAYASRESLIPAWQSRHWPSTSGHISGSVVHEGVGLGMTNDGTSAPADQTFRQVDRTFTYQVAGQRYQSSQFSFSASGWQENDRYLDDETQVTVYYCPSNPSLAVLRPGLNAALITGPALILLGFGLLLYSVCVR